MLSSAHACANQLYCCMSESALRSFTASYPRDVLGGITPSRVYLVAAEILSFGLSHSAPSHTFRVITATTLMPRHDQPAQGFAKPTMTVWSPHRSEVVWARIPADEDTRPDDAFLLRTPGAYRKAGQLSGGGSG